MLLRLLSLYFVTSRSLMTVHSSRLREKFVDVIELYHDPPPERDHDTDTHLKLNKIGSALRVNEYITETEILYMTNRMH